MVFSYNTLQTLFSDTLPPVEEVAEKLGLHIFELEGVEETGNGDYVIDWDVLPNRSSDCLSYQGIAHEIAAIFDVQLKEDTIPTEYKTKGNFKSSDMLDFTLNTDLVTRATKRVVTDITVSPSPDWLQDFLTSTGQNSINNVVDITNYVMWMTGQPVHAFDLDKLAGDEKKNMTIRHAADTEEVTDLTGAEHKLDSSMLVVADSEKALDVAGIKGGNNSGVDEHTTRVVVSACNYDFQNIRATARTLKLHTDASKRYENEVPNSAATNAQVLCAKLLEEYAGGVAATDYIDMGDRGEAVREVSVSHEKINSVLGLDLDQKSVLNLLERLSLNVELVDDLYTVSIGDKRPDLTISEDLIEEVGRLYGYYNIEPRPIEEGFGAPEVNRLVDARNKTVDILVMQGFYQSNSRSIVSDGVVALANALTSEATTMRTNLVEALERRVERNFAHTETPHFFEIGKVFTGVEEGVVQEHWSFAGILGRRKIKDKQRRELFLQTKGAIESVTRALGIRELEWEQAPEGVRDDSPLAIVMAGDDIVGSVGVNWWELNFENLVNLIDTKVEYQRPSKYPKMDRDVAVWVPLETRVRDVRAIIEQAGAEKCIETTLFDVYEDKENNRKSIGFRLVFQCYNETLSDEWTNGQMEKVYSILSQQKDFEIR